MVLTDCKIMPSLSTTMDQTTASTPTGIITLTAEHEFLVGKYFKTTWRHRTPPYQPCAIFLQEYIKTQKKFKIVVLHDKRELLVPLGFTLIEISETEAHLLVDARRKEKLKPQSMNKTTNPAEEGGSTVDPNEQKPEGAAPAAEKKAKKEKAPKADNHAGPSRSQIIKLAIAEGLNKDQIQEKIMTLDPTLDVTKVKAHIAVLIYAAKKKAADAASGGEPKPKKEKKEKKAKEKKTEAEPPTDEGDAGAPKVEPEATGTEGAEQAEAPAEGPEKPESIVTKDDPAAPGPAAKDEPA